MMTKRWIGVVTFVSVLATGGVAAAEETADASSASGGTTSDVRNPFSLALLAGHGFEDAFGTGFGARVGYTLPNRVYLGATFLYHLGMTEGPVQANVNYGGGEVGYDITTGPMLLRAYAGFGLANSSATVTLPTVGGVGGGKVSASDSRFAFWPGASVLLPFEDGAAFVGVDAKYVVVDGGSAFNTYGTFGLAF